MNFPASNNLPINLLSACFNRTTSTYKYYWFLAILQSLENGRSNIPKIEIFSRMIANSWYTVNYFNISFGKQDLIQKAILSINQSEKIPINEKKEVVFNRIYESNNRITYNTLWHFNKNVPHWFLSPWFPKFKSETDSIRQNRIYNESKKFTNKCLYALYKDYLIINDSWIEYLVSNAKFLKDFCFWNLALFLQSKNPNVPDIPNKLIKPARRNSLAKQKAQFWDIAIKELGSLQCIYTGKDLTIKNYALEHFVPYSFVSHDLIWNLIPADPSFNSSKGSRLPQIGRYFKSFYEIQKTAFEIVKKKKPKSKILLDYLTIYDEHDFELTEQGLKKIIQPLISIASNNGFEFMKYE